MGAAPCPKIRFLLLFLLFLAAQQPPQLCNTQRPPLHPPFKMSLPNYNPGLAAPAQGTLPGSAGAHTKP